MKIHANRVWASAEGEYFQVLCEAVEDSTDPESPYLVIQRQFEDPDGGRCYVETHDSKFTGHFRVRRLDLSCVGLLLEIDRPGENVIEVTFAAPLADFDDVARVAAIIAGSDGAP